MAQFIRIGKKMDYIPTSADLAVGAVVTVGAVIGVAEVGGIQNKKCSLTIEGVFDFVADGAINQGAAVYLVGGKAKATGEVALGKAMTAAANGATVLVKINA